MPDRSRVLLVEAEREQTGSLRAMLDDLQGVEVDLTACTMLCEALMAASSSHFDIALVEVDLPDGHGVDVVAPLVSIAPHLPLVAFGDPRLHCGADLVRAGAEDFVVTERLTPGGLDRIIQYATHRGVSRANYRGVLAQLPDPLITTTDEGVIEFANAAAATLFGRASAELVGRVFPIPVVNESGRAETWIHHAAGAINRVELAVVDATWSDRPTRLISIRDITQRHAAEGALHAEARKFETLVGRIPGVVWTTSRELELEFLSGGQLDNLTRYHAELFDEAADPARLLGDAEEAKHALGLAISGRSIHRQINRHGRHWEIFLEPLRDDEGEILGVIGFAIDATEQSQMKAALAQAQKLEAVGQLAAGVAHELNTPMQYVNDNLQFLQKVTSRIAKAFDAYEGFVDGLADCEPQKAKLSQTLKKLKLDWIREQSRRALEQSLEGVSQASRIVRAMKESVHTGSGDMAPADINKIVRGAIDVSRNEWKYVATVDLDLDHDLPVARVLAGEISQVVLNLVINAAHAIAERESEEPGRIHITTSNEGEYVEIRIEDDAGGIPVHVQPRIFDPFFTTKEVGKGTGQGLSIARRIVVDTHGGTLEFDSRIGEGTVFTIRLPFGAGETEHLERAS